MSQVSPSPTPPDATALNSGFAALHTYDRGSSRAALLPIDRAAAACLADPQARAALEQRLLGLLQPGISVVAREYICSKLTLIGSERSVPLLSAMLHHPELATAARNALEAIPGRHASKALREALPQVEGPQKIGVINSLGARRDADSVGALAARLRDRDADVAAAAAGALGEIATSKAAKILRAFLRDAPPALRQRVADACLVCAERALAAGNKRPAGTLYQSVASAPLPRHVQNAARRGLERMTVPPRA